MPIRKRPIKIRAGFTLTPHRLFDVKNDDRKLTPDDLKNLGVCNGISSAKEFFEGVKEGYERALNFLRELPPGRENMTGDEFSARVHKEIFSGVLKEVGAEAFRKSSDPTHEHSLIGHPKQAPESMREALTRILKNSDPLLKMEWGMDRVKLLSRCSAMQLAAEPFKDVPARVVNRTVVMAILESRLEHSFGSEHINRCFDAKELDTALKACLRERNPHSLDRMVESLAGPRAHVYFHVTAQENRKEKAQEKDRGKDK